VQFCTDHHIQRAQRRQLCTRLSGQGVASVFRPGAGDDRLLVSEEDADRAINIIKSKIARRAEEVVFAGAIMRPSHRNLI
jgi:hypothetical protein